MTISDVRTNKLLLLDAVSGSHAYGLNIPTSDVDHRGVFILPEHQVLGLDYVEQVSDKNNDMVYYEVGRWVELLIKNNPNMLELLAMPAECVQHRSPVLDLINEEMVLSKLCRDTFAGYARAQIRKARGLNKKVLNPMDKQRKGLLDFCHVLEGQGTQPVQQWLEHKGWQQEDCGLVNLPHAHDLYALFHDPAGNYKGIVQGDQSNSVSVSSIPKAAQPVGYLSFNKDGYVRYCKDYKAYWEWVEKRNEARYENTIEHGKNYDAKNMMHTFRLLDMAEEIAREGRIRVRRPNRDFLLEIRRGEHQYEELVKIAEERLEKIDELYAASDLPAVPDRDGLNAALIEIRRSCYAS